MKLSIGGLLSRRGPERARLRIGYVPTLDAALLLVAQAKGFFADQGLEVRLQRQTSWQRAADRLAAGDLDAAHLSATEPLARYLGMNCDAAVLPTAFVLAQGGSGLAVKSDLAEPLAKRLPAGARPTAATLLAALAELIRERAEAGEPRLRFVVTEASSTGSYDLRYCLASVGIDPEKQVELAPITPVRTLTTLRQGQYDGAWLDEPFGSQLQAEGHMQLLFSKQAFWNHSMGKVLAVSSRVSRRHPRTHRALLRALLTAGLWAQGRREDVLDLIASKQGLDLDGGCLGALVDGMPTLAGADPDDLVLSKAVSNFPWYSQAVWYLGQMIRWGDYAQVLDFKKTAQAVFQPRYYREAARELDLPHPSIGYKNEGEHAEAWELEEASQPIMMGPDLFFDGRLYKPRQTMRYLNGLEISHIAAPLDAMWAIR